jgi:CO/xanthine dehydrogenase FAD-binding subunit
MDLTEVTALVPADAGAQRSFGPGDAWLAGGSWLFSEPQPGLHRLFDLSSFGWPALTVRADGLEIAATCTFTELAQFEAPADWSAAALFAQCCAALLGSFKVWNVATVGGNICLSLPAGPMTSLTSALDGVATIWTPLGPAHTVAISDFVTGAGTNALAPGDLMRSIFIPAHSLRSRTAFRQFSLSPVGRSAVVVIGRRGSDDGAVFTVTASTVAPVQLRFASWPDLSTVLAALTDAAPHYHDDIHGHPVWREHLTRRYLGDVHEELS